APWTYDSIARGFALLFKTGKPSVTRCLDLIMDENIFQDERADTLLKGSAVGYLLVLPAKERGLVFKRIPQRLKRTRSALARRWGQRAHDSLASGRIAF